MKKAMFFAPAKDIHRLAGTLGGIALGSDVSCESAEVALKAFREGDVNVLVCCKHRASGWRAPEGTDIFFLDGFTQDEATRAQALARVGR